MNKTIAVVGCKGGIGKSSMVQNLGYELSQTDGKILLCDFDPQSNLTLACGIDPSEERETIYHAMHEPAKAREMILSLPYGMDILPSTLDLAMAEQQFAGRFDRNDMLKNVIEPLQAHYDYILIDSPPSLGFFSFCALNAATEAIIPLQAQPFAYRMVAPTMELIELVGKSKNELIVRAIVLTMYDRRVSLTESIEEAARQTYSDLVAKTVIPVNVAVSEATLDGIPVALYNASSAGTQAYKELCEELYG